MISIRIDLYRHVFHGLRDDASVDWPPSPARVIGALMSGAYNLGPDLQETALEAVQRIAQAPPPVIVAPQEIDLQVPDTYTDRTAIPPKRKLTAKELEGVMSLSEFAMNSSNRVAKPQGAVALAGRTITYLVDVEMPAETLHAIGEAAQSVPYFGRSNDPATLSVEDTSGVGQMAGYSADGDTAETVTWYPAVDSTGPTRGWADTTPQRYDTNYERVMGADDVVTTLPIIPADGYVTPLRYQRVREAGPTALTVLPLERSLDQWLTPRIMKAVAAALPEPWYALPLTSSQSLRLTGRLVGIGIAKRTSTMTSSSSRFQPDSSTLRAVLAALGSASRGLPHGAQVRHPAALEPGRWVGPARRWRSTTPLRAFPDLRVLTHQITQQGKDVFGAAPEIVEADTAPRTSVDHRWSNGEYQDGNGLWWLTVEFPAEIKGPLVLGAGVEDGFGVFRPVEHGPGRKKQ